MTPTLLTGATGFIGRRLLAPGVRALVRKPGLLTDAVAGDITNPESLPAACAGIHTVLHCAGYAHALRSHDPEAHWRVNLEGTRNLLRAAGGAGVERFVFLSSVKAMAEPGESCVDENWPGAPITPYGQAKRAAEDAVREAGARFGMHVVNLRLSMVYGRGGRGNLERMAYGIRAGWFPPLPKIENRRSLVHVDDVVAAIRQVATSPIASGRTYIIADPQSYSSRQLYDAIRTALGLTSVRWSVPAGAFRAVGMFGGRAREVVDRLIGSACYSPMLIEQELGWRSRIGLAEGLGEMLRGTELPDPEVRHNPGR